MRLKSILDAIGSDSRVRKFAHRGLTAIGYDPRFWTRLVMYQECSKLLEALNPPTLDVLEVGSGPNWRSRFVFRSYRTLDYPQYDICKDRFNEQFDLVIADNVFEHLLYPYRAARNVLSMLRPGGSFLNIVPFLIPRHDMPVDCTRWTEVGLRHFLEEAGFDPRQMHTGSWGNLTVAKANLRTFGTRRGWFRSLRNQSAYPVQVWALARRPEQ